MRDSPAAAHPPGWWLASDGRWYPPQLAASQPPVASAAGGGATPSQPPWWKRRWVIVTGALLVLVVIAGAIVASDGNEEDGSGARTPTTRPVLDTTTTMAVSGPDGEKTHAVGETVRTGDLDVTLLTVEDPWESTDGITALDEASRFVAVEVTLANNSDQDQVFAPLLLLQVRDGRNRAWDVAFAGFDLPRLDGVIVPGDVLRGWEIFEVGSDASNLTLRVKGSLTAPGALFRL